ncbi:class I SAM-dependent methyltransferase [Streptomyces sp. NPDC059009]|uniref:class I SAM-dependent methyltransferase n=1 Tax=Streptomyces sp. NPDC059009 TaxID=3346694 RepID=UPI003686C4A8
MIPTRLAEHYEAKYAAERTAPPPDPFPLAAPRPTHRAAAAVTALALLLPEGADVLELGAGNGVVAESLRAGGVPFRSYTIGDISPPRLAGLRRTFGDPRIRFAHADAERPSATVQGPFDAVVMIALIEHLVDPLGAMRDIRSLLRPGGFAYVDTPNLAKWTRRLKLAAGRFPSTASTDEGLTTYAGAPADLYDEGHLHYFTHRSLGLMLTRRCGYAEAAFHPYFESPRFLGERLGTFLARARPTLFSDVACVARTS